mmetsp:Transcript_16205/g.50486  ORF Transcript_16205/g.50486 Transcript_16205/m.50486 type:complete len:213 (+) Transcript_16205:247-885(+)
MVMRIVRHVVLRVQPRLERDGRGRERRVATGHGRVRATVDDAPSSAARRRRQRGEAGERLAEDRGERLVRLPMDAAVKYDDLGLVHLGRPFAHLLLILGIAERTRRCIRVVEKQQLVAHEAQPDRRATRAPCGRTHIKVEHERQQPLARKALPFVCIGLAEDVRKRRHPLPHYRVADKEQRAAGERAAKAVAQAVHWWQAAAPVDEALASVA